MTQETDNIEAKYKELKSQVVWAVTHYNVVDTDGIMGHLKAVVENLDKESKLKGTKFK